ncbi:MAG: hypothetical protein AB7Q97_17530 [Gammaproteobacteria bacterium]
MEVKTTLRPGQKGTRELMAKYGDRLVCVRYRYDRQRGKRYKTVEIIVAEQEWHWQPNPRRWREALIRVEFHEAELRERIRAHGGRWDRERKLWRIYTEDATALGVTDRIVDLLPG